MNPRLRPDRRVLLALAALALVMLGWAVVSGVLLMSTLEPAERDTVVALIGSRLPLAGVTLVFALLIAAIGLNALYRHYIVAPARLLDEARILLGTDVQRTLTPQGAAENRALADVISGFAEQRAGLRADVEQQVREASRSVEQERSRLAALMSELTQSVVVCNLDGRILLYNNRARLQFRALSDAPAVASGAELIGLGRSIYTVFDRKLVAHALENIQQRMQRGVASPSAQFVTTTRAGQLLRAQMTPVRAGGEGDDKAIGGFVLMLDNITRDFEEESARDRLLLGLTEGSRASLANMQAAIDMLDFPDLDTAMRERFHGVIRDEVGAMSARVSKLADESTRGIKARWPLEDMLGADLVSAALRRIESLDAPRAAADEVDGALWLKVDSFSLLQALACLAYRLADEYDVRSVQLRLGAAPQGARAHLDLIWQGQTMSTETVMNWQMDGMTTGSERSPLSVRDVVERHGGEFWLERERVRHRAFFRFLLPLASEREQLDTATFVPQGSRPEYYDFDLFRSTESSRTLADRPLTELTYTVFDTETTGLNPSEGDEIIQIGAARIVNGKLLRQESFEQLVDPQRKIPAASIPIHGITQAQVDGQPTIATVLPAFHAFAQDTVLVAHNAAFDMRFLQLKEAATGLRFEQPVLDTLLLSALVHPNQESHRLEAIAERFNITVIGRHTALGDAIVTAEVFLRLIPLLAEKGIHTLGDAREAAQQTYYARLKY
ncbi:exonuclease, DNA polymerase III, epsilon subunit family domain protein [Methyloversatilis sp. RAC08]|uniref:3'-5' exonuclease n=1 Tax=Methyloversatilis sp. RAC08 TaxID=1842540 RepID=UPI0008565BE9|nr:exonuclease domain-containing protein [Methyloversatilis sp. RAC08]AOF83784.1 exonuclease, DNA polymerase III, epsilon subunit family domain protein [Methyloversatilis sp. RAC08]